MINIEDGVVNITNLGKGPAISSFLDTPLDAHLSISMQLKVAERLVPQEWLKSVLVLVFATAGMRLVDPDAAKVLYDRLLVGLVESDFPFDSSALRARTISGHEEGLFALLAANYLSGLPVSCCVPRSRL